MRQAAIAPKFAPSLPGAPAEFPPGTGTEGTHWPPIVLAQAAPAAGGAPSASGGAAPAAAAKPGGAGNAAQGQGANPNALPPLGSALDTPLGQTPNVPGGGPDTGAPAWEIEGRANLTEIGTDNVGLSRTKREGDLISEFSAGV